MGKEKFKDVNEDIPVNFMFVSWFHLWHFWPYALHSILIVAGKYYIVTYCQLACNIIIANRGNCRSW